MNINIFNNFGVGAIAIVSVLNHSHSLSLAKLTLIFPLISHEELLSYLSNGKVNIKSLDKLLIDKTPHFSNFNKRYYDSLPTTFNSLQYLVDLGYITVSRDSVNLVKTLVYAKEMGGRANKIFKSSENIASILKEKSDKLYLNLRIEL